MLKRKNEYEAVTGATALPDGGWAIGDLCMKKRGAWRKPGSPRVLRY